MDLWVRIQDISENKPLTYKGEVPLAKMEDLVTVVGEQSHEAHFNLHLSRSGKFLFIKGEVEGKLVFSCDRCLESFGYLQQEPFSLTLSPLDSQKQLTGDLVLSDEELEVGIYQGEWLDLQKVMEEQILLGIPMKKICSETCKGICPQCGSNLNMQACTCPPPDNSDHPFASLR